MEPTTTDDAETKHREEVRANYRLLGRIFLYSGWAVAFVALFLGKYLLDGMYKKVVALEAENAALKQQMNTAPQQTPGLDPR